jgi:pyruvate/2-oxoglutarate dehydrogenase complex dihydrolipoamide dehydrogenase (E3) component
MDYEEAANFSERSARVRLMSERFLEMNEGGFAECTVNVEWTREIGGRLHRDLTRNSGEWRPKWFCLALGFRGQREGLLSQLGIAINERGNVAVDADQMTTVPKFFGRVHVARAVSGGVGDR